MTMDLLDLMDDVAVHALAAATGIDSDFTDVAVGFPPAKGRCVRIFYGGEREPAHMGADQTLNSKLVGQAVVVRAYFPTASTGASEQRLIEGQLAAFFRNLRSAVLGDASLSGDAGDVVEMHLAQADQVVISDTQYAAADAEIVVDYDEHGIVR